MKKLPQDLFWNEREVKKLVCISPFPGKDKGKMLSANCKYCIQSEQKSTTIKQMKTIKTQCQDVQ